ncbi:MAG: sulfotransferase [Candidatus Hydrothermarchaeales archaeon]
MRKPNLFIVGAPKSGTTSLYNYLKQHPDIFMSKCKETFYFCKDFQMESG